MTDEIDLGITPEMKEEARLLRRAKEIQEFSERVYAQMIAKHWTYKEMTAFAIDLIRRLE